MGHTGAGSTVRLATGEGKKKLHRAKVRVLPHSQEPRKRFTADALVEGQVFQLLIEPRPGLKKIPDEVAAALLLWLNLGGLGKRSRRGFGSLQVSRVQNKGGAVSETAAELLSAQPNTGQALADHLREVLNWASTQVPHAATFSRRPPYPVLDPSYASVLVCHRGQTTQNDAPYKQMMLDFWNGALRAPGVADDWAFGSARGGRRASPFHLHMPRTNEGYHLILTTFRSEPSPARDADAGWTKVDRFLNQVADRWDGEIVWPPY
jgi:CRISPR-associated protein Cmr1